MYYKEKCVERNNRTEWEIQQVDRDTGSNLLFPFFRPHKSRLPLSHTTFKNLFISNLEQKLIDGAGSKLVT